ncbi:MAG: hypothetical protein IIB53_04870 [Planctomycetes bacterium]|nr:hypothetical protein [Planctomycetota bacterium]
MMLREAGINLRAIDAVADEQNWNALANLVTERREPIDPRGADGFWGSPEPQPSSAGM